uniref:BTB domain-containing protein n=1 Tax=Strigamia maritima TaxID=126957 RepID=T1JA18_STRMM
MDKYREIIESNLFDIEDSCSSPSDLSYLKRAIDSVVTRFQSLIKQCGDDSASSKENKSKINEEKKFQRRRPVYIVLPTDGKPFKKLAKKQEIDTNHCGCCCCHVQYPKCEYQPPSNDVQTTSKDVQTTSSSTDPSPIIKATKNAYEHQKTQPKSNSTKEEIHEQICHLCGSHFRQDDKYRDYTKETTNCEKQATFVCPPTSSPSPPPPLLPPPQACSCFCQRQFRPFETKFVEEVKKTVKPKSKPRNSKKNGSTLSSPDDIFHNLKLTNDDFPTSDVTTDDCNQCHSTSCELWNHYIPVLENLKEKKHATTDVIILLGPEEFYAHKVVLSAYSEYFHYHLLKNDRHCFDITAEGVTVRGFHLAMKWMYSGQVEMTEENIGHLWTVAKRLGIRRLCKLCKQQLRKMIRQHGKEIVEKLIGDQLGVDDDCAVVVLEKEKVTKEKKCPCAKTRASANVKCLLKSQDFVNWSSSQMTRFLSHNELRVTSEKQVFDMAAAWLRHNWPERKDYVTQITNCVRFSSMTRNEIMESFTQDGNQILWTNKDVVTNVLIAYLGNNILANKS